MVTPYTWPAIITVLNIALLMWVSTMVGNARKKYGIAAPATTGDPMFERIFRVQMNTLENSVIFLPALWLAAVYGAGSLVVVAGLIWIGGRVVYALAYVKDPAKRSAGFGIASIGFVVLLVAAIVGIVRTLIA
jgi:glutathione S-transferase